ncbi:MAG: cell division protein FtsZ [Alphaproteobacteria bacterium]|jgi:cell division protein FtsZ|nr:cell division protein FtsZ [Alphaproteobacteria bacterium]
MTLNIDIPEKKTMIPKITVLGVGGAGGNAINNMISLELQGVNFVVANTDAQALSYSKAGTKIQLGEDLTKGLGAGSSPEVGGKAVDESKEEILSQLSDSNMVFITAGMGGGTGTGAAPAIAKLCREVGILTVGVITKPFHFEGSFRMKAAENGVSEMQKHVDTLICIPNQNLFHKANEQTTFADAFSMVDDILYSGIKGVTDLMTMPGLINLDFADIRAIMGGMGKAMMGTGESGGDKRALDAAESAISNPLLDNASMQGAKGVLINISGGLDMTLFEADEAAQRIKDEVDPNANIIFGSTFDKELDGKIRVSVVATGIDLDSIENAPGQNAQKNQFLSEVPNNNKSESRVEHQVNEYAPKVENQEVSDKEKLDFNNAFIPPQVVDPASLQQANTRNEEINLFTQSVAQINETGEQGSNVNNLENSAKGSDLKNAENSEKIASLNIENAQEAKQASSNNVVHEEEHNIKNSESKAKYTLGGIFSFFKDNNSILANNATSHAKEFNHKNQVEESSDLVLSDDILNVPTFLRNKEGGSK